MVNSWIMVKPCCVGIEKHIKDLLFFLGASYKTYLVYLNVWSETPLLLILLFLPTHVRLKVMLLIDCAIKCCHRVLNRDSDEDILC